MDLKAIFKKENLILPDYNNLNFIDLMRAIYSINGIEYTGTNVKKIIKQIPKRKNMLFILIDGMGSNLIENLNDSSILKKNKKADLLAVSPSTTGCVLTSLATAEFPEKHGIIGWFNYNREFNIDYYPLLFADRKNKKTLSEFNIKVEDIFKNKSLLNNLPVKTNILFPNHIVNSVYSKFVANDNKRIGYKSLDDAFSIIKKILDTQENTFNYLYIPDIDTLEHYNGVDSKIVSDKIIEIESYLKNIISDDVSIIITSDHGQTNIFNEIILDFNKYNKYFYAYPGIDFETITYYIKKEYYNEFENEFNKDYNNHLILFKTDEFIKNKIFGLEGISEYMKNNLGEYISICKKGSYLINTPNTEEYLGKIKGCHSGFTSDEIIIPLIII